MAFDFTPYKMPDFVASDCFETPLSSQDLLGKKTVIFFYPKDMTPGCTKEACQFRDAFDEFKNKGVSILGISPDGCPSHIKFIQKHDLPYTLISDQELHLCKLFEVYKEKALFGIKALGVIRSTFIIDEKGYIVWQERKVKVAGHVKRVLEAIDSLNDGSN